MVFYGIFLLVADVEVKEDGVFIRLRKETVVCEDKDSSKRVSFSGVSPNLWWRRFLSTAVPGRLSL